MTETSFNTRNSSGNAYVIKMCASDINVALALRWLKKETDINMIIISYINETDFAYLHILLESMISIHIKLFVFQFVQFLICFNEI